MAQRPPHQCSDVFTPAVLVSTPDVLFPCWEVHPIFHLFLHQDVTLPSHLHFQALLLTLWTFLPSAGRFSLAGGLRPAGLRGPRQGGSPVCPVRPLLFYCFWPLPPLLTQSMKHVVVHSCLKAGTEGLTDSFLWGDEGGGAGSGRPWGTTWLPSRGTPPTSTGKCLEGSSPGQVRLHSSAGEWTGHRLGWGTCPCGFICMGEALVWSGDARSQDSDPRV